MVKSAASSSTAQFQNADDYWTTLTDAELQEVVWTTDAPLSLPGLQPRIPANLPDFIIELEYQLDRVSDPPVPCAHCPHHQPHWHGFVLLASDGARYLLGSHCGPKAYSSDYLIASSARNRAKKRAEALLAWQSMRDRIPDILTALAAASREPSFVIGRGFRSKCIAHARGVLEAMARINRHHLTGAAELRVSRNVRDEGAETDRHIAFIREAAKLAHLPNKEHRAAIAELRSSFGTGEIWRTEERDFGILKGADWLIGRDDPFKMLDDAGARLRGYHLVGQNTADKPTSQIQRFTKEARKDIDIIGQQIGRIRDAEHFFAKDNIDRLTAWATAFFTERTRRRIVFSDGILTITDGYGEPQSMRVAAKWEPPGSLLLDLLST